MLNIPLIYRQESEVLSTIFCLWEFLICMAQCQFDTLNAPADKLLLLQLIKLGGHSAISGRWHPFGRFEPKIASLKDGNLDFSKLISEANVKILRSKRYENRHEN
ncbi:MAG: hypothetical protein AAF789_02955 [Bacteroidota bacterium]